LSKGKAVRKNIQWLSFTVLILLPAAVSAEFLCPIADCDQISSGFKSDNEQSGQKHNGVDLVAPTGTAVVAPAQGLVVETGERNLAGKYVKLDHGDKIETLYLHLSKIHVIAGDRVERGEKLGLTGTSGLTTGPHLHFEVREQGEPVGPLESINNDL